MKRMNNQEPKIYSKFEYNEETIEVLSSQYLKEDVVSIWFRSKDMASTVKPGQFLTIQVGDDDTLIPVLRRPFAISSVKDDTFEVIFHIVGKGTKTLSEILTEGSTINILGPLGNGFDLKENSGKEKLLLAGGLGIAPIKSLMEYYATKNEKVTLLWGNRTDKDFYNTEYLSEKCNKNFFTSTDDGSLGFSGNILELLNHKTEIKEIKNLSEYDIFVVGPTPMMRAVANNLMKQEIDCQVSLETPMACGIGVCQGCAVEDRKKENSFYLVCKDGPVFNASDVEF